MTTVGYLEVLVERAAAGLPGGGRERDLAGAGLGAGAASRDDAPLATEGSAGTRARADLSPDPAAADSPLGGGRDTYDPGDSWRLEQVVESVLGDLPEDGSATPWSPWLVAMEMLGLFDLWPTRPGNEPMPGGLEPNRAECRRRLAAWLDSRRSTT